MGIVRRPHGLSGEVSLEPLGDFPDVFEPGAGFVWKAEDRVRDLRLSSRRPHGKRLLLSFGGIGDPKAARELTGGVLCVLPERLPRVSPDFYWTHEVKGWSCEDPAGGMLGVVRLLEETPGGPLLTMVTPAGKEILVPFVHPIVVEINRASKKIVLDPPEGLLDL